MILFTDVESAQRMSLCLRRLTPRHLPLVVTIADETVEELELMRPQTGDDLYRVGLANELVVQRAELLQQLRAGGAGVLDSHADRVATQTIERYFELKRRLRL
jgi:uncharacterized protein (DUF58 family)